MEGETKTQSVMHLPCKHKDLNSDLHNPHKKLQRWVCPYSAMREYRHIIREAKKGGSPEAHRPDSLFYVVNVQANDRVFLKQKIKSALKNT